MLFCLSRCSKKINLYTTRGKVLYQSLNYAHFSIVLQNHLNLIYSSYEVVVSGGSGNSSKNSECFSTNGWKSALPDFNVETSGHCMVMVNSTRFLVIGGNLGGSGASAKTFEVIALIKHQPGNRCPANRLLVKIIF